MNKEIIIRSINSAVDFALLHDGKLIELHKEKDNNKFNVGDIFIANIKKTITGLNAAFLNVGYEKDAFLHYHDLGPRVKTLLKYTKLVREGKIRNFSLEKFNFEKEIDKKGSIEDVLSANQTLIVQIIKEPISTKGPRISSELSFAGRFVVLVPFSNRVSVSQKIKSKEERKRLKALIEEFKPKGFGVIVRTVAQGKKIAELKKDLQNLNKQWVNLCKKIKGAKTPSRILNELNRSSSILRDLFDDDFTGVYSNNKSLCYEVKDYIEQIAPKKKSIVKYYKSDTPIFEHFNIERQIKTAFGRTVSMSKGAYLIIEHTEALHVIDVNSGNRSNKRNNQEETALEVNLIAATEIARQLRLRDMGGIIVVDFIDMVNSVNRKKLFDHFKTVMESDKAKHKILPPSKIGLIQMTRQRVRPEMNIRTKEDNPNGIGKIEAPIVIIDKIQNSLEKILKNPNVTNSKLRLHVHPFIAAYLTKGFISIRMKWLFNHRKWVKIIPRDSYTYLHYRFFNTKGKINNY
ncbi:MAG: Rne/Rng family ribonuclease [Flavobacteriaceae bacterium]